MPTDHKPHTIIEQKPDPPSESWWTKYPRREDFTKHAKVEEERMNRRSEVTIKTVDGIGAKTN